MVEAEHGKQMDEQLTLPLRARGMTPTTPSDLSEALEAHRASTEGPGDAEFYADHTATDEPGEEAQP